MHIFKFNFQNTQCDIITNLDNITLWYKPIINTTSPHKTQHSHLQTFRFITLRYMFQSITLNVIMQGKKYVHKILS